MKALATFDALAASAASVIAMAGTKVCMSPVAMMMVHNPATIAIGDTEEMQKAIDMLSSMRITSPGWHWPRLLPLLALKPTTARQSA